jgi:hypothetical protein
VALALFTMLMPRVNRRRNGGVRRIDDPPPAPDEPDPVDLREPAARR